MDLKNWKRWRVTTANVGGGSPWSFIYTTRAEETMATVAADLEADWEVEEILSVELLPDQPIAPKASENVTRQIDLFDNTPQRPLNRPLRFWDGG